MRIRGETIKYATKLKKSQNTREKKLIEEIDTLEKENYTENLGNIIDDKKQELEDLRNDKIKGNIVRARVKWLAEGEEPSRYFCQF